MTTNSQPGRYPYPNLLKDLSVNYPDQIWCADITYVPLACGQMADLALLFDVFTEPEEAGSCRKTCQSNCYLKL